MKVKLLFSFLIVINILLSHASYAIEPQPLLPEEQNTIKIFQTIAPLVVNIHKLNTVMNTEAELMQVETGMGSGFIWDKAGHIVTNFHVIKGANEVAVSFGNGKSSRAKLVGAYPIKDIAVLQVLNIANLPVNPDFKSFPVSNSDALQVGQNVIAIGNPYGLDHTLTRGVISALNRDLHTRNGEDLRNLIQTDASINPGNSGGPLLNSQGNLIGINTAIYSPSGASSGIGFAIPANAVQRIVKQLIEVGKVTQSGIGVQIFSDEIARQLRISGVIIQRVVQQSPAAIAGLRGTRRDFDGNIVLGDIITAVNATPITKAEQLVDFIENTPINTEIQLTYLRDNKLENIKVKTKSMSF